MTQREKMVSRSRKEPDFHDPERKNGFWVKKRTGLPLPGEKKWFLGQGSRQASMTRRGKLISRSRKEPDCHDPERKNDFWVKEAGKPA